MNSPTPERRSDRAALWALLLGNFVVGAAVLAPAGLINELRTSFAVDAATVGSLLGYGAAVLCIEAPLLAFLTNSIDRRVLLTGSMLLFAVGHAASAFAPSFGMLMLTRLVMIGAAAVFTPQAAAVVSLFVRPEHRSGAVAFVFLGWSLASAFGIPGASLISAHFGWSAAYQILAGASVVAAIAVAATLPAGLRTPHLSVKAWACVFSSRKILLILSVTAISLAGQFTVYPFVASELKGTFHAGAEAIAVVLALFGVAGMLGAAASTAAIDRLGAPAMASLCLVAIMLGLGAWSANLLGPAALLLAATSIFIWGLGFGPGNSAQQARLIAADPTVASASVALNTSAIYVGQASGSFLGGRLLTLGHASSLGFVGAALLACALIASLAARMKFRA